MEARYKTEQQWRHRKQTCGQLGKGEVGESWESSLETHTLPYVKQMAGGIFCVTQGAQYHALWQPRGEGLGGRWEWGSGGRGYTYTCDWFMLMYGRNQHNIVKQLASNKLKKIFKSEKKKMVKT